jgi:hypothetical protein
MTYLKYAAVLLMIISLIGCGKKDPLQPETVIPDHIMPLKLGNSWVYEMYFYNPGDPNPAESYYWHMTVTEDPVINSEQWYIVMHTVAMQSVPDDIDTLYFVHYTNREDGLWLKPGPADVAELKTKYPVSTGENFTGYSNEYFFSSMTFEVISTNSMANVPAGNYSCYHYAANPNASLIVNDYHAPRVGMVRSDWLVFDNIQGWFTAIEWELRQYSVH